MFQELTEEDKVLLDEVKQDMVSDGLRWSMETDRKIIHLWKKLKRTEKELQASSQKVAPSFVFNLGGKATY